MIKKQHIFLASLWCLLLIGVVLRFSLLGSKVEIPEMWLLKELARIGFALAAFGLAVKIGPDFFRKRARGLMLLSLFVLVVMQKGWAHSVHGASRWIDLGFISFQPSEFIKIVLIIYFADFLTRHKNELGSFFKGMMPAMLLLFATFFLIVSQPDFGTSVLIFAVGFWMMCVAGVRIKHLLMVVGLTIPLLGWLIASSDYRMQRLQAWLEPQADIRDLGYQVNQSKWAIREGGMLGKGFMDGDARHGYLPESTSDFIASIWIEETGTMGFVLLVALFSLVVISIFSLAGFLKDSFTRLLVSGLAFLFSLQILFNLGVVTGFLPNKGIPLPLISSGGSSLVATAFMMGLVWHLFQKISLDKRFQEESPSLQVWNGL